MKVRLLTSELHHGAVGHAEQVGVLLAAAGAEVVVTGPADVVHAQFTDALWGRDIVAAATAYQRWAASTTAPVVVTLHDVPGGDPDGARDARRAAGYARVVAASDEVIVSSLHEATKVAQLCGRRPRFIELPLPVFPSSSCARAEAFAWAGATTLGLLGFLYPGKGHAEAIDVAARQSPVPWVVSLGAVSPGHQALRQELDRHAAAQGVRLVVTGALAESALVAAAASITVPLSPNRLVSASASLLAWIGCRRRPVSASSAYSCEISARHPGQISLYDDVAGLDSLIRAGVAQPERTKLTVVPPWFDVGAQHVEVYRQALRSAGASSAAR
jgi:hypothetical protein